ncbi:MAG: hypothetical protein SFY95_00740 [Planctomycetota bacterium]|nr:hypothetical protein [Planctomycetota bacterium]
MTHETPKVGAVGSSDAARTELAARLTARARFLPEDDAALVLAVYRDGLLVKQAAAMIRRPASSTAHRVRRLVARLASPEFAWCLRQLERQAAGLAPPALAWTIERQRVATLVMLHGHSLRETARRLALSVHHVRKHVIALRALFETHDAPEALETPDLRRSA